MKMIGIVGQIGSGKSTIREMFNNFNTYKIHTIDLDAVSYQLRQYNSTLQDELQTAFGSDCIGAKKTTASIKFVINTIFSDYSKYMHLVSIYEPYIKAYLSKMYSTYKQEGYDILLVEGAALIHSSTLLNMFDTIINVTTPINVCKRRVIERNKYTMSQINLLLHRTQPKLAAPWNKYNDHNKYEIDCSPPEHVTATRLARVCLQLVSMSNDTTLPTSRIALYPGSFNPFHIGHLDIVRQACKIFDHVVILKMINGGKQNDLNFPINEDKLPDNCEVIVHNESFISFLQGYKKSSNLTILRGIRNGVDLEYEQNYIAHLKGQCELCDMELPPVLFIPCSREYQHISSSSIKAILPFNNNYARSLIA